MYNSFGCISAIRCSNAYHRPHSDSVYSGSEHHQFNSPRLVKHEAGFPNPRRALSGSNQLWHVNDSPYYRELVIRIYEDIYVYATHFHWLHDSDSKLCILIPYCYNARPSAARRAYNNRVPIPRARQRARQPRFDSSMQYCIRSLISITNVQKCCKRAKVCDSLLLWHFKTIWIENICL